jgi:soluble lytic murein transglycosylase-like protein
MFARGSAKRSLCCGLTSPLVLMVSVGVAYADVIEVDDYGETHIVGGNAKKANVLTHNIESVSLFDDAFDGAANKFGVDVALLRAVAWTESHGRADAISSKGALGIMQLMPGTAAELRVNPHDPQSNIAGGAAYLARQLTQFGSVPLALAAYNAGPGAVIRWRGVPPFSETRAYVDSIMRRWSGSSRGAYEAAMQATATMSWAKDAVPELRTRTPIIPAMLIEVTE